jgi:hypothetical protein
MKDRDKLRHGHQVIKAEVEILLKDLEPAMVVAVLLGISPKVAQKGGMSAEAFIAMVEEMLAYTLVVGEDEP